MKKSVFVQRFFVIVFLLLSGCGSSLDVQVIELSNNTVSYDETIHINNCGGKADSEQTASRSFATNIEGGAEFSAGYQSIVEGGISAKYSQYRNVTKSQKLIAPPGTNMEIILRWSEEVYAGNVTVNGATGNYEARVPVAVEQVSSQDLGGCSGGNAPVTGTPQFPSPLQDVRIRRAIAYCTDRHTLAQSVYPTFTSSQIDDLMMDSVIPKTDWAYVKPTTQYPFNPAKGQSLLDEAGWHFISGSSYRINATGDELSLTLTTTQAEIRQIWASVFETQMQVCGIRILRLHVTGEWLFGENTGLKRREFEMAGFAWAGEENFDADSLFSCNSIPTADNGWQGDNYMGWCNENASEAAEIATDAQISQSDRKSFFAILQEEAAKDMPSLPLFVRDDGITWEHIDFDLLP